MKTFIKGIRKPSGREVELEWHDGGPQSIEIDNDSETTQPRRGGLRTWVTTDSINGSLVHFRSKGVYASLGDDQEFLGFIAKAIGEFGNNISIEYTAPDQDEPLLVTVDRNKITVKMHTTGEAVAASLETALSGSNNDLVFTAKEAGVDGNDIGVEYITPVDEDVVATSATADGDAITVELEGTGPVAATLVDSTNKIKYTAKTPGSAANATSDQSVGLRIGYHGAAGVSVFHWNVSVWAITTDGLTATCQEIIDGVNADSDSPFTAEADTGFNGATTASATWDATGAALDCGPFAGGAAASVTATADDVKAAIEADEDSDALISVEDASGNDGSGTVTAYGPQNLSGGADAATIISTASEVKAAIEANSAAAKLVNVTILNGNDDQTMFEMSETNLLGGDDNAIMEGSIELSQV